MVAEVLVELQNIYTNKTFSYLVNDQMLPKLKNGMRVVVPFSNQTLEGFVIDIHKKNIKGYEYELKEIISITDDFSILNDELLDLGKQISKMTLTPLMLTYQAMLPKALKAKKKVNMKEQYDKYITLNINSDELKNYKFNLSQQKIINLLLEDEYILKSLLNTISISSIKTLINKKIIREEKTIKYRYKLDDVTKKKDCLLPDQQKVFNTIIKDINTCKTFLLFGVTGSGKTNVYMEVIEKVIHDNKTALLLVPEISLTPQIIKRFTRRFDKIAVLHSGLSDGEKYDEWRKINNGEVNIVIGARSAIFAPLKNIGVIIIDEEHSLTYKQDNMPRYNAIDVAKIRSRNHNCPLILGSATPSLESFARAKKNVYQLLELKQRANQKPMPNVKIVDMNYEFKKTNSFLSDVLINTIKEKLLKKEQVILFLNRRGYANFIICKNCGNVFKCPNCDISLTYHKSSNMLRCHYCGYATKKQVMCPSCHEEITDYGIGTEKLEEEITKAIKEAKIVRMDIDTTTKKGSHKKIVEDFMNEKYNILLGTQMIAKGLDFPKVTLVGVVNADISLNIPDFRSSEYTFQLLNQVSGRSGRDLLEGEVIIQTYNPTHYAIVCSKNYDYEDFYNKEMIIRKQLMYPPYYYLIGLKVISNDYDKLKDEANKIKKYLDKNVKDIIILGPSIANPFRINNKYRLQIIIKYKKDELINKNLVFLQQHYIDNRDIKLEIDFNPTKL